jgi:hypothetical protein
MAFEDDVLDVSMLVADDLSAYQYCFVKLSGNTTVTPCTGATDDVFGILQNKPNASGQVARVRVMGISRVLIGTGGAVTFGQFLGTDADSKGAVKSAAKAKYLGVVVVGANAGEEASVLIQCGMRTITA